MRDPRPPVATSSAKVWIVSADATRARIFLATHTDGGLSEIEDLLCPAGRVADHDLDADRAGHVSTMSESGGHALSRREDSLRHQLSDFARSICHRLLQARTHGDVERIYLVAGPRLLGLLREHLDDATRKLVVGEIEKDISHERPEAIREYLPAVL